MKYLRDRMAQWKKGKLISKLKKVKNFEIIVAVVLALIAAISYVAVTVGSSKKVDKQTSVTVSMDERETKLANLISEISGVGRTQVLITSDGKDEVRGVVVVAEGADNMINRVKVIRCVETATGVTVDKIQIFEMNNGG